MSGGSAWEIIFCFYHLEKKGVLRLPIGVPTVNSPELAEQIDRELARGSLVGLADVKATGIDAVIIPGGPRIFGNLCNFNDAGEAFKVDDNLKGLLKNIYRLEKPIGAFGSSSALVTKALQGITKSGLVVTVGSDPKLQAAVSSSGAQAVVTRPGEVVLDQTNKLVSSGGELGSRRPAEVSESCENLITGILELLDK